MRSPVNTYEQPALWLPIPEPPHCPPPESDAKRKQTMIEINRDDDEEDDHPGCIIIDL